MIGGVEYRLLQQPPVHQYVTWCDMYGNITEVYLISVILYSSHDSVRTETIVGIECHCVSRRGIDIHTLPVPSHTVGELLVEEINDMYMYFVICYKVLNEEMYI